MGELDDNNWLAHEKPRDGQIEMISACYSSLENGIPHLTSAPTGIGKTAAALAAALELASKSSKKKTILFLTPKQAQHQIVVDTVIKINQRNDSANIRLVDIIGRESMCENVDIEGNCDCKRNQNPNLSFNPEDEVRKYILESPRHVQEIIEISKSHSTCAWAVCRSAVKDCDLLVCDYNHLFIESIRERSLISMNLELEDLIIIVDEAHNLPERVRLGMQRRLFPEMILNAKSEVEEHLETLISTKNENLSKSIIEYKWTLDVCKKFEKVLSSKYDDMFLQVTNSDQDELHISTDSVIEWFTKSITHVNESGEYEKLHISNKATILLSKFARFLSEVKVDIDEGGINEKSSDLLSQLIEVLIKYGNTTAISLIYDVNFGKKGRITSSLLDAGLVAGPVFAGVFGAILMSGTLNPPNMYADLLGIENSNQSIHKSPFEDFKRPILVATDVSTKLSSRNRINTQKIQKHIYSIAQNTPGNVAVFAPSYKLLTEFTEDLFIPNRRKLIEDRDWSKQDVTDLLVKLNEAKRSGTKPIIFGGVFGGRLSEGIDYSGGILDTVICIGIQNPVPNLLQKSYGSYIKEKFGQSNFWRYANSQPAVNTILQAMGRPIRSMGDRALIVLLDKRNLDRTYSICYPPNTKMNQVGNAEGSGRFTKRFFSKVHREENI
tara:strand:+ start:9764 stop:11761 length:1998 start_codon:yes stop_codon:yes gene_type:complete